MATTGRAQARRSSRPGADPNLRALGQRIRSTRLEVGIGLRELARRIGCSPGLVSQIEHGMVGPSVATLYAIARELRVPIDTLFYTVPKRARSGSVNGRDGRSPDPSFDLVRSAEGERVRLPHGVEWRRLAGGDNRLVEFREITYRPGAMSNPPGEMLQHEGQEHGFVVEGCFHLQVGDEVLELAPGDSIAYSAQTPHRLWNQGTEAARAVWLIDANAASTADHDSC